MKKNKKIFLFKMLLKYKNKRNLTNSTLLHSSNMFGTSFIVPCSQASTSSLTNLKNRYKRTASLAWQY
jgi:hypothetical protein